MRLRYLFIIGFVMVAQSLLYDAFFMKNPTKAPDIERRIGELFVEGDLMAEEWLECEDEDAIIDSLWHHPRTDLWKQRGIAVYLYSGDTLRYWLSHTFSEEVDSVITHAPHSVEQFDGNTIMSFCSFNDNRRAIVVIKLVTSIDWFNEYVFPDETEFPQLFTQKPTSVPDGRQVEEISVLGRKFYAEVALNRQMPLVINLLGWVGIVLLVWGFKQLVRRGVTHRNALQRLAVIVVGFTAARLLINYVDVPNGGSFSWSSLGSLLITYMFLMVLMSAVYSMRFRLRAQVKMLPRAMQYGLLVMVAIFMCAVIVYFHYSMVELIKVNTAKIEIYNIFSLNSDSLIFYVVCAIFVAMRMLYSRACEAVFSAFPYWARAALSVVILIMMVIPLEAQLVNTGFILVMFHVLFLAVYYLSRRQFVGRQFMFDLVVFAGYITFFSAIETFAARTLTAKEYANQIASNPSWERVHLEQPPKSLWFAVIKNEDMTLSENNNYELLPLLAVAAFNCDTMVAKDGINHIIRHRSFDKATIVVSFERPNVIRIVSLWSYIFLWLLVVSGMVLQVCGLKVYRQYNPQSMIYRVRAMIFVMVIFSMGVVAVIVYQYSGQAYAEQQKNALKVSVQELRTNFNAFAEADSTDNFLMRRWLRLSNSSRTSLITLFDTTGMRLLGVNDSIFLSRMSSDAYAALHHEGLPYYEKLSNSRTKEYAVAYTPLYWHGAKIGYMGVLHLNAQNTYRKYSLLSSIFNVFVIVLLLSIALSLELYTAISKPLSLLYEGLSGIRHLRKIELSGSAIKLDDEVGTIIKQYNAMIDYLEESYAALARSEREGAWREMAKQVAHEIKNPLTPMRLKIQMLQRSRAQGAENCAQQLDSTLAVLLEQIDILSRIANEFSDLARLPEGAVVRIELTGLLESTVALYASSECISVRLEDRCKGAPVYVNVDYASMSRVVVNLLQNALQSIVGVGEVVVSLSVVDRFAVVEVRDTGRGIRPEVMERMFEPNFTTKSSGSGLGLAICRQIIENFGGTIEAANWQKEGSADAMCDGAVLTVRLPLA